MKRNDDLINELESKFRMYHEYDKMIERQKEYLNRKETDENFGGGRSSFTSNPTEQLAIKYADDDFICDWTKWKNGVERTLSILSETERALIEEKYWGAGDWMNWKEFAKSKHYSAPSMSRLKQKTLMIFGRAIKRIPDWE